MKKRQHYIWRHYLSSWTSNDQIWCKREGKCFNTSLENIGQKRFFYKAERLNLLERKIVENFIFKRHPSSYESSLSTLNIYDLSSEGDDVTQKTSIEEYHTLIEHTAIDIMATLRLKDMSWLKCKQSKINFSRFLGVQYSRTNRNHSIMSEGSLLAIKKFPQCKDKFDPAKVAKVFAMLMGDFIGNWIYSSAQFSLIENNTGIDFITGDQPIFNLDMKGRGEFEEPEKFNLYYPLSPELALLISKEIPSNKEVSLKEVEEYNDFIERSSYEQLYSKQEVSLAKYGK